MAFGTTITMPTITGTHTDMPMLITEDDLPTGAYNGADSFANGGGNLVAYTDSTKATQLPVEVVSFVTGGTPSIEVWVKRSAATGNTIYLEADATQTSQPAVTSTYGRNAVWADYEAVWHMGATTDSTGNGYDLTFAGTLPTDVTGKIGEGQETDGTGDYATFPSMGTLFDGGSDYEISSWVKSDDVTSRRTIFHPRGDRDVSLLVESGAAKILIWAGANYTVTSSAVSNGTFHNVVASYDADGNIDMYLDGAPTGTSIASVNPWNVTDSNYIGRQDASAGRYWDGTLDEIKVRTSLTDANFKATENDNQNTTTWFSNDGWSDPAATGATVTDINTDEIVLDAEQNCTFTTTGFGGEITTVTLVSGSSETSASGVTSTSGAGDFDLPDVAAYATDTVGCPFTSASHSVVARLSDE